MEITCSRCKQTWEVPAGQLLAAKIKFGLGSQEHAFTCPNCGAQNLIPEGMFRANNSFPEQIPVTGSHTETSSQSEPQTHARRPGGEAPVNPVPGPEPSIKHRGVVMVRSLDVRRDHSMRAETMAGLRKGERVKILDTWTDGDDIWAQLGPERWVAILYEGEGFIELLDE